MPSTSPGRAPTAFAQILPGAPTSALQAVSTFVFRHKRYIAYLSGKQLNILSSPTNLLQTLTFNDELVAVCAKTETGKIVVGGKSDVYVLAPVTEGWTRIWWEKSLALRTEDAGDEASYLDWGSEGEVLVGGSRQLSLFSTLPSSRTSTPAASPVDGRVIVEERKPLWSKAVASGVQYAAFSPSASLIATCGAYDRLVKIWRRLSFEEGLFDYTYLPHPALVTHLEWRPLSQHPEDERRGSGISGRHEEDAEVLYTIANDGVLRVWRTCGLHDLDLLTLHTTIDLVTSIPQSPNLTVNGTSNTIRPTRYAFLMPSDTFCAAVATATSRNTVGKVSKLSHSLEHLKEVITKTPDVVVVLDGQGRMSAWGLQSIGHKRRPEDTPGSDDAFHVAHAEGLDIRFAHTANVRCCAWFDGDMFNVLAHDFGGMVAWWRGDVETFFSPSVAGPDRLMEVAVWSGHSTSITGLRAEKCGTGLLSRSEDGVVVRWALDDHGQLQRDTTSKGNSLVWSNNEPEPGFDVKSSGIANAGVSASNAELAAFASSDGADLVIVDRKEDYVEHHQIFTNPIQHLRCFDFGPGHNVLAVGSRYSVDVLMQGRYAAHHEQLPAWHTVKKVSVADVGLRVAAVEWLKDGVLAIATGNGIMLTNNNTRTEDLNGEVQQAVDLYPDQTANIQLSALSRKLKEPLPVWHPSLLSRLVRHGEPTRAFGVLGRLLEKLKFWSEGEHISPLLDDHNNDDVIGGTGADQVNDSDGELNDEMVKDLMEQLSEKDLPAVSDAEQTRLKQVLEALAFVSEHVRGLDKCALRYLFSWKLQLSHMKAEAEAFGTTELNSAQPTNGLSTAVKTPTPVPHMHWRDIAFAFHSTTQQPLLDILTLYYDNKLTWPISRALGITAWLADKEALESVFEALAQSAYRSTSPPDPSNASLYFLALHKKATLLGLWRIATWHREQRVTLNFLKKDFTLPETKTAAKKNAYALMGKRRFEYAAAFFLLADDAASAVSLLAGQCGDTMLAIAVARLYSGDRSDVVRKLLEARLMPQAENDGDRWAMSWCHALLGQRQDAAHALVKPLTAVSVAERHWHQDDPATLMLYRIIRKPSGSAEHEYEAVLRAARVLRRMGMWSIALEMVSQWHFQPPAHTSRQPKGVATEGAATNGASHQPASLLDSFGEAESTNGEAPSLLDTFTIPSASAPPMDEKAARAAEAAELLKKLKGKKSADQEPTAPISEKKREPTQFKEPDASSLLGSFGF